MTDLLQWGFWEGGYSLQIQKLMKVSGLASVNCPYCQDNYHCKISIWRDQGHYLQWEMTFFSLGSVYVVGMRCTNSEDRTVIFDKTSFPKLSSAIELGFDMASVKCKLSVRCLRSSYRLHLWVLDLPTTVSDTDFVSYNACIMLSGPANADVNHQTNFFLLL